VKSMGVSRLTGPDSEINQHLSDYQKFASIPNSWIGLCQS
jgi:hypothetical protein